MADPTPQLEADASPDEIEEALIAETHRLGSTRASIAHFYARAILTCRLNGMDAINWARVNGDLLDYYTPSGVDWIKAWAWKHHLD